MDVGREEILSLLRWAIKTLGEYLPLDLDRDIPMHDCEYDSDPDKGYCDFCEQFARALEIIG